MFGDFLRLNGYANAALNIDLVISLFERGLITVGQLNMLSDEGINKLQQPDISDEFAIKILQGEIPGGLRFRCPCDKQLPWWSNHGVDGEKKRKKSAMPGC